MSIIATVTKTVQIGSNSFRDINTSREFEENRSISDILSWARTTLNQDYVSICEIQFSDMTGKSL